MATQRRGKRLASHPIEDTEMPQAPPPQAPPPARKTYKLMKGGLHKILPEPFLLVLSESQAGA